MGMDIGNKGINDSFQVGQIGSPEVAKPVKEPISAIQKLVSRVIAGAEQASRPLFSPEAAKFAQKACGFSLIAVGGTGLLALSPITIPMGILGAALGIAVGKAFGHEKAGMFIGEAIGTLLFSGIVIVGAKLVENARMPNDGKIKEKESLQTPSSASAVKEKEIEKLKSSIGRLEDLCKSKQDTIDKGLGHGRNETDLQRVQGDLKSFQTALAEKRAKLEELEPKPQVELPKLSPQELKQKINDTQAKMNALPLTYKPGDPNAAKHKELHGELLNLKKELAALNPESTKQSPAIEPKAKPQVEQPKNSSAKMEEVSVAEQPKLSAQEIMKKIRDTKNEMTNIKFNHRSDDPAIAKNKELYQEQLKLKMDLAALDPVETRKVFQSQIQRNITDFRELTKAGINTEVEVQKKKENLEKSLFNDLLSGEISEEFYNSATEELKLFDVDFVQGESTKTENLNKAFTMMMEKNDISIKFYQFIKDLPKNSEMNAKIPDTTNTINEIKELQNKAKATLIDKNIDVFTKTQSIFSDRGHLRSDAQFFILDDLKSIFSSGKTPEQQKEVSDTIDVIKRHLTHQLAEGKVVPTEEEVKKAYETLITYALKQVETSSNENIS